MKRRDFLAAVLAAPLAGNTGPLRGTARAETTESNSLPAAAWRQFEVTTRVALPQDPSPAQFFLPLAQTAGGYQLALDLHWQGSGTTERVHDARYGAPMLRTIWTGGAESKEITVVQTVATRDRGASTLLPLTEAERRFWTAPTASAPVDGIVREHAARLTAGTTERRAQLRAIYDWVVDHTHRDPDTPGCGTGDIVASLASGKLGGKCADINSLMAGLARAARFPAREVYGIRVADSRLYPSLGRRGDISKAQHCRCEVFLEDEGWFPVDPADVRKVVLEEKVALDSPAGEALREQMFGRWEMNWVGYNSATDLDLPGSGLHQPSFHFLMYPCAFTADGMLPSLDPARFHYEISAKELTT